MKNQLVIKNLKQSTMASLAIALLSFLLFSLTSCQEELNEVIDPSQEETIQPGSGLAGLLVSTSAKDGSPDNILDGSSCISLVLPVTATVNGVMLTIASADDFKFVEQIWDESQNDSDTVILQFPISVKFADYAQATVVNYQQLKQMSAGCQEGGMDFDIECIDFKYPISFSKYNTTTQSQEVLTVNTDEEMYDLFKDFHFGDLMSMKFPVTLVLLDGGEIVVNNNTEMRNAFMSAMSACDEDDDFDFNDDDLDDAGLVAALTSSNWKVFKAIESDGTFNFKDNTAQFSTFTFSFLADGTVTASNGSTTVNGTWQSYGNNGLELVLDFGTTIPFSFVTGTWKVTSWGGMINLFSSTSIGPGGAFKSLVFNKI
jgi:hypothetical protein